MSRRLQSGCCCVQDDVDPGGCGQPWTYTTEFGKELELRRHNVTMTVGYTTPNDCYGVYGNTPSVISGSVSTGVVGGGYVGYGGSIDYDALPAEVNADIAQEGTTVSGNIVQLCNHECTDQYYDVDNYGPLDAFKIAMGFEGIYYYNESGSEVMARKIQVSGLWFNQEKGNGIFITGEGTGVPPEHCECRYAGPPNFQGFDTHTCNTTSAAFPCADAMYDYKMTGGVQSGVNYGCGNSCADVDACALCAAGTIPPEVCKCIRTFCSNGEKSADGACTCANDLAPCAVPIGYDPNNNNGCCAGIGCGCQVGHLCIAFAQYGVCGPSTKPYYPSEFKSPWLGSLSIS